MKQKELGLSVCLRCGMILASDAECAHIQLHRQEDLGVWRGIGIALLISVGFWLLVAAAVTFFQH